MNDRKTHREHMDNENEEVLEKNVERMQEEIERKQAHGEDQETDNDGNVVRPPQDNAQHNRPHTTPGGENVPAGGSTGGFIRGKPGRRA